MLTSTRLVALPLLLSSACFGLEDGPSDPAGKADEPSAAAGHPKGMIHTIACSANDLIAADLCPTDEECPALPSEVCEAVVFSGLHSGDSPETLPIFLLRWDAEADLEARHEYLLVLGGSADSLRLMTSHVINESAFPEAIVADATLETTEDGRHLSLIAGPILELRPQLAPYQFEITLPAAPLDL